MPRPNTGENLDNSEIILNLWYVYDALGMIYSLRARCYIGSGSEEEKRALLRRFAPSDYLIAQPFPIPDEFHTTFASEEGQRKLGIVPKEFVNFSEGASIIFEQVYCEMEKQLPAQTQLSIGQFPLVCITPLIADEDCKLTPITFPSVEFRAFRNRGAFPEGP
jgi:hypothetical protein